MNTCHNVSITAARRMAPFPHGVTLINYTRSVPLLLRRTRWFASPPSRSSTETDRVTAFISGPPGGGKGTISKKIRSRYNFHHISTGDTLRDHVQRETELGLTVKSIIATGALVPDEIMIKLIVEEFKTIPSEAKGVLLDGFPRTVAQSKALEKLIQIDVGIDVVVPFEEIIDRISSRMTHIPSGRSYSSKYNPPREEGKDDVTGEPLLRREDDSPEVTRKRLEEYEESSRPLLEFYRTTGKLVRVDGESVPELVKQDRRSDAIMQELTPKFEAILNK